MGVFGWLLAALIGWTAIGVLGTLLAMATGDRRKAWKGGGWIVGVWTIYMAALLAVGRLQGQRVLAIGQEECFGKTCYAVTGYDAVGEFKGEGGGRLVQVRVRVRNGGPENAGVEGMRAYLVDAQGRRWWQTRGLGGIALAVSLPAGGLAVSEPVFRVAEGADGLGLVLTRGHVGWGWLVIGDTDGLGHRHTVLRVE
jgi:hypothetical protein